MPPTKIAVNFRERKFFLNVLNDEPLWYFQIRIKVLCGVALNNDDYTIEVYDSDLEEYVVLSQPYLTEIHNNILCRSSAVLEVRIRYLESERRFI